MDMSRAPYGICWMGTYKWVMVPAAGWGLQSRHWDTSGISVFLFKDITYVLRRPFNGE